MLGGPASIRWLEWFMGFPDGWSGLNDASDEIRGWGEDSLPKLKQPGEKKRTERIKALGNAQVPAQTAMAWQILSKDGDD